MVTIRAAMASDDEAMGLITVTASLGSFVGRIPEQHLDLGWRPQDSAAGWRAAMSALPPDQFFLVAEVQAQVVGFVWAGLAADGPPGEAEIKGLYVLPTRQREGLGRRLVVSAIDRLRHRHTVSSLIIGCVKENPSCGFYQHLGGVERSRRPSTVDRHQTEEIVFHWADLSRLS